MQVLTPRINRQRVSEENINELKTKTMLNYIDKLSDSTETSLKVMTKKRNNKLKSRKLSKQGKFFKKDGPKREGYCKDKI